MIIYMHTQNRVLFGYKEDWNHVVLRYMDVIGGHHVKWNKLGSESQRPHFPSPVGDRHNKNINNITKKGYTKGRSLMGEGGWKKEVK
jgi:hypothetical protein